MIRRGEFEPETGVPGKSDGEPDNSLEYSKECEWLRGGV